MGPVGRTIPTVGLRHGRIRSEGREMEEKGVFFGDRFFRK